MKEYQNMANIKAVTLLLHLQSVFVQQNVIPLMLPIEL